MRAESQARPEVALRAARARIAPSALGAVFGVVAALAMPRTAGSDYFGVAAQVLPVLLLALAIEARLFGGWARVKPADESNDRRHYTAGTLELGRQMLSFATVAVLIAAEIHALIRLADGDQGEHAVWLENGALVWGFTTVAVLAFLGTGSPRLIATLDAKPHPSSDSAVIVEVGASNEYGDKDVSPVQNFLVPTSVSIDRCDANGNRSRDRTLATDFLHTSEEIGGVSDWNFPSERLLVSAGDATVRHFLLGGLAPGRTYRLVLRYDHVELPRGRVEVQLDVVTVAE